jgi:hypothetical protein
MPVKKVIYLSLCLLVYQLNQRYCNLSSLVAPAASGDEPSLVQLSTSLTLCEDEDGGLSNAFSFWFTHRLSE